MQLLGGQLITFNSIFKLAKLLCQEQKKEREGDGYYGENKTPLGAGKSRFSVEPKLHLSAGCFAPFLLGNKSRLYSDFKIHIFSNI